MKLKRKLLVVAGSGASIDFGMPSVSDVDKFFRLTALQNFPLTSDPQRSLYDHVYRVIRDFWRNAILVAGGCQSRISRIFFMRSMRSPVFGRTA